MGEAKGQLREIIQALPQEFNALLGVATFRAAEMRAQAHGCEFDMAGLQENYKRNPFEWIGVEGQSWSIYVFAMWTWQLRGCERRELVRVRLDELRTRGFAMPNIGDED